MIMVNHGSESEDDEPLSKRICEDQVTACLCCDKSMTVQLIILPTNFTLNIEDVT